MDTIKIAEDTLMKDKKNNISIINFIKNNQILSVDIEGDSVMIKGESDRRWIYISSQDEGELKKLMNKINKNDDNFAAIDEWMIPILVEKKNVLWDLSVVQFYLSEDVQIPAPKYKTVPLIITDAHTVYENSLYKDYISVEYVAERIQKGISAGLHDNSELVSWAVIQDDGAIGFLHTLSDYRKKGYGLSVTLSIIEKLRKNGELPFAYVEVSNKKSMNLLLKLGFIENKRVHWFQIGKM